MALRMNSLLKEIVHVAIGKFTIICKLAIFFENMFNFILFLFYGKTQEAWT